MQRHLIGSYAGGVAGMKPLAEILNVRVDPVSTPITYAEVGTDLTGTPVENGYGTCTWTWDVLAQEDFQYLLDFVGTNPGAQVYIRTRLTSGAMGADFANFEGVMKRPVSESIESGLLRRNVTVTFQGLVPA